MSSVCRADEIRPLLRSGLPTGGALRARFARKLPLYDPHGRTSERWTKLRVIRGISDVVDQCVTSRRCYVVSSTFWASAARAHVLSDADHGESVHGGRGVPGHEATRSILAASHH